MRTISLFLLFTLGVIENSHGPFQRPDAGANHALAAARGNVLLAWSEKSETGHARVHVRLLDFAGRPLSQARELPVLNESRDAIAPVVSSDGASFVVAWQEVLGMQQTVAMTLDANGEPAQAPQRMGLDAVVDVDAIEPPRLDDFRAFAVKNVVTWVAGAQSGSETMPVSVDTSAPQITEAGAKYAVVWSSAKLVHFRLTNESHRRSIPADADANARPRIDCASTNCVVAYATRGGGIAGLVFDHTRADAPLHFQIAQAGHDAEVAMISNARALITWHDGEKLVSRSVNLGGKQRAVR